MASSRRAIALLVVAAAAAVPRTAGAFCRTSTCDEGTGSRCEPPQDGDCGIAIKWPNRCIGFSIQEDASPKSGIGLFAAQKIFMDAFETWMAADCGGGGPDIRIENLGAVACDQHEFNQEQELGNANIIIFRDDVWPHGGGSNVLALTTVTYDLDTADIYDADMEINTAETTFTVSDTTEGFDLLSIAAHETGHFLGLSHTPVKEATMFADYIPGTTTLRDLTDDDRNGICAIYPNAGEIPDDCDPAPVHGLASECDSPPGMTSCCTVAPGAPAKNDGALLALALGALVLTARRRVV